MRPHTAGPRRASRVRLAKVRAFGQISSHKLLILKSLSG